MQKSGKPYVRWWWFSHIPIIHEDIQWQLDWLKKSGFGGVELQWTMLFGYIEDFEDRKGGPYFLDAMWQERVAFAKKYANQIGLGCDFTFGTLWPFGGTFVKDEDKMMTLRGEYGEQMSLSSFEFPERGNILNHLNRKSLANYAKIMGDALKDALQGEQSALFCDSWEINSKEIWDPELDRKFYDIFGYNLKDHLIDFETSPDTIRYDYRKMISKAVTEEFYQSFTDIAHSLQAITRIQTHGSPTDLLASYASADIPESECLLFPVQFSRIAASAAALAGRPVVSCETFTCMYKFPDVHFKKEYLGDMKLLADAVIANGVNRIVYHGMPYNGPSTDHTFYATVHIGPYCHFSERLPKFNEYLTSVCELMSQGNPTHQIGVYLPFEDNMVLGELPSEQKMPGAQYYFEMRNVRIPQDLEGFNPLWVSNHFLKDAEYDTNLQVLQIGNTRISALYVDCNWLDLETLRSIHSLAQKGLPVILENRYFKQPGLVKSDEFLDLRKYLKKLPSVHTSIGELSITPMVHFQNGQAPYYWAREQEGNLVLFIAHPLCRDIKYPMEYEMSKKTENSTHSVEMEVNWGKKKFNTKLEFGSYESLIVKIDIVQGMEILRFNTKFVTENVGKWCNLT